MKYQYTQAPPFPRYILEAKIPIEWPKHREVWYRGHCLWADCRKNWSISDHYGVYITDFNEREVWGSYEAIRHQCFFKIARSYADYLFNYEKRNLYCFGILRNPPPFHVEKGILDNE